MSFEFQPAPPEELQARGVVPPGSAPAEQPPVAPPVKAKAKRAGLTPVSPGVNPTGA